jgi:pimeloyl-ACP methyl ester carboxylesterase
MLAAVACGSGDSREAAKGPDGRFIVGGRALALHCSSGPIPTVVIDAGLGESSAQWQRIAEELGSQASVCTFDRAGYGDSDPGPLPRSPIANAQELRALLSVAELQPPFVLVGHSLGALNAQAFWTEYPGDVAGLVLLDPPPKAWLEGRRFPGLWEMAVAAGEDLQAAAAQGRGESPSETALLEAMASEHQEMLRTGADVAGIDSFGDLNLLVVAAGRPNPAFGDSAAAYQQFWIEENRTLAGRSTAGRVEVLGSIGHGMNHEAPSVLLELLRGFLAGI